MPRRTPQDLQHHVTRSVGKCRQSTLVVKQRTATSVRCFLLHPPCRSYLCQHCRRDRYLDWRNRLANSLLADTYKMWTLSARKQDYVGPDGIIRICKQFDAVWREIRKRYGRLEYFRVVEIGAGGNVHFHILLEAFIDFNFLNNVWQRVTSGSHTQYILVPKSRVMRYVTKYLTKSSSSNTAHEHDLFMAKIRRVSTSWHLTEDHPVESKCVSVYWISEEQARGKMLQELYKTIENLADGSWMLTEFSSVYWEIDTS